MAITGSSRCTAKVKPSTKTVWEIVKGQLDHKFLNDVMDANPTAENMARWICGQVPHCYKVQIQESEGNLVEYEV